MGIKQHNGNTKADRLAELKIRSPSIQLIKFGAIGLNAIIFSPLLIAADTGSQYGTNITINEGDRIKKELKKFPPSYVVWDAEDLKLTPPWGNNISSDITDLSNYFVTNEGRDLISVLNEAMEDAKEIHSDIEIDKL